MTIHRKKVGNPVYNLFYSSFCISLSECVFINALNQRWELTL